jgi:hypothetical protein
MYSRTGLELAIEAAVKRPPQSPQRLREVADLMVLMLASEGLPNVKGGQTGELSIDGLARRKDWDVAYEFAGKFRLAVSLKSMWNNAAGTVPNRLDDLMGEVANVQQLSPEIVSGYVILFDTRADSMRRNDGLSWSQFFEQRLQAISIRRAPMWNQGLLEGHWFVRFDGAAAAGGRVIDADATLAAGQQFARGLVDELRRREPAVPFRAPAA